MEVARRRRTLSEWVGNLMRMYGVFAVGHVLFKIVSRWLKARRMWSTLENVPSAKLVHRNLPFIRGFLANKNRLHDWRCEITEGLPVCKLRAGAIDPDICYLALRDPACVNHVLKDNFDNYTKPDVSRLPVFHFLTMWLGNGIFVTQHGDGAPDRGRNWLRQRKLASNIFSRSNFNNNMQEVFARKAQQLVKNLEVHAAEGRPVDMQMYFFQFTMDSIMLIFFGEESDTVGGQENIYATAFDTAHRSLVEYILRSMLVLMTSRLLPWPFGGMQGLAWRFHQKMHPKMREFQAAYAILDSESRRLVSACRDDPLLSKRKDLLGLFVQAEGEEEFSPEFLRDVVLNFVIAGRDTTACTLSWMFYILSTNPEVQRKLQDEIDEKLPLGSKAPSFKGVAASELPYLNGVLYETFRLYPPVPLNIKEAAKADTLPDGSAVPEHCKVMYMPYAIGRDAAIYPNPEEVKPERWIPFVAPSPAEFPVFQAGPRVCLGMDMAIFEAKLAACALLQRYDFSLKHGEAENINYSNTLTMSVCNSKQQDSHCLWLVPRCRKQAS